MRPGMLLAAGMTFAGWIGSAVASDMGMTGTGQTPTQGMQMPTKGHHDAHGTMHGDDPDKADYARTRWSTHRLVQVSYAPSSAPVAVNTLQTWVLTLTDPGGHPIADAQVEVAGDMPEHGHGLPTVPQVRSLGSGRYLLEGLKFHMPGWWVVKVRVTTVSSTDEVTFNLKLE